MVADPPEHTRSVAIDQLEALGLSTYAARTFVALARLGGGTAKDVSEVSDVPRTRVYDAVEELQEWDLVDVRHSTPKRFRVVSTETTGRLFEQDVTHRVNRLTEALDSLDSTQRTEEQRGVWTVTGRGAVTSRVGEFIETAEEEIVYMTVHDLLTDEVLDSLRTASERGVSIKLAEMADTVERDIRAEVPDADLFDSMWAWSDTAAGRVVLVARERTLVSVLVPGDDAHPPEPRNETAIWGSGETNSLVVVMQAMFAWQLDADPG